MLPINIHNQTRNVQIIFIKLTNSKQIGTFRIFERKSRITSNKVKLTT